MSITPQESRIRALRRSHDGRTSRGLSVELARLSYEHPVFGDDSAELLADLKHCAADCIGAGCEPRLSPLPGQDGLGACLAAPAEAHQAGDTTVRNPLNSFFLSFPFVDFALVCVLSAGGFFFINQCIDMAFDALEECAKAERDNSPASVKRSAEAGEGRLGAMNFGGYLFAAPTLPVPVGNTGTTSKTIAGVSNG